MNLELLEGFLDLCILRGIRSSNPAGNLLAGFLYYKEYKRKWRMKPGIENATQTMQTLYDCIFKAVEHGYYESFKLISRGLATPNEKCIYNPSDIAISNLYKGQPLTAADGSVLYLLKTIDGRKGTLIRTRRSSSDVSFSNFMDQVYSLNKTGETRKFWFNFLSN